MATEHSQEFKDSVVARLLAKELTVAAASQQYQISEYTLYKWRKATLNDTVVASQIVKNQQIPTVITTLHLPKDVSHMRAHEAVIHHDGAFRSKFGNLWVYDASLRDASLKVLKILGISRILSRGRPNTPIHSRFFYSIHC